jgi:cell division protein FtsZ
LDLASVPAANRKRRVNTPMPERERIAEVLRGSHMAFITAGMGGGTGTGAAPVVAEVARELGILTVAVVSKPFDFEMGKKMRLAEEGLERLAENVDSLIVILNDKLDRDLGRRDRRARCVQGGR